MDAHRPSSRVAFGQLVPDLREPRMPAAAEHRVFEEENRDRAIAAADHDHVRSEDRAERVWTARRHADLEARLDAADLAVWAEDDILHVLWRGTSDNPILGGGLQGLPLWTVDGLDSVWEVSLRVTDLQRSLISVMVMSDDGPLSPVHTFRGALRPQVRRVDAPAAPIVESSIESKHLRAARGLSLYRHRKWTRRHDVVLVADGQNVREYARYVEAAIDDGRIPPVALIGIHGGPDRHMEYLSHEFLEERSFPADDVARAKSTYDRHMAFVLDEVIDWVREQLGHTDPASRFVQGNSNGAAWALEACQQHPAAFAGAIGFSVAGRAPLHVNDCGPHRYALAAGTLEPFLATTEAWARALESAGHDVDASSHVNGHDGQFWAEQLPCALAFVTRARTP